MKTYLLQVAFLIGAVSVSHVEAQVSVASVADQAMLLRSADPSLARNKKLVYDFWREVLEAGHVDLAAKYLSENYIQHNPNVPTGRRQFIDFFSKISTPKSAQSTVRRPLVGMTAEGDLVVLAFVNSMPNPNDPARTYTTTAFDMFRVQHGRIVEHWDDASLMQLPPPN